MRIFIADRVSYSVGLFYIYLDEQTVTVACTVFAPIAMTENVVLRRLEFYNISHRNCNDLFVNAQTSLKWLNLQLTLTFRQVKHFLTLICSDNVKLFAVPFFAVCKVSWSHIHHSSDWRRQILANFILPRYGMAGSANANLVAMFHRLPFKQAKGSSESERKTARKHRDSSTGEQNQPSDPRTNQQDSWRWMSCDVACCCCCCHSSW